MKLSQLFEYRTETETIEVEYEFEHEDANGDYETSDIVVEVDVVVSGSGHRLRVEESKIKKAYFREGKKPFNIKLLSPKSIKWIKTTAEEKLQ